MSVLFLFAGVLCAGAGAEEPRDLPTLPEHDKASVRDVNNRGHAVGQSFRADLARPRQAVLWTLSQKHADGVEPLPTLAGWVDSDATALSRNGKPVGTSSLRAGGFTFFRAVIWRKELGEWRAVELGPPPGYTDTIAADVNSRGQVVGWAFNPGQVVNGDVVRRAVVWVPDKDGGHTVVELETPEGFQSTANGINELGDVVGTAYRTEVIDMASVLRSDVLVWKRVAGHLWRHRSRYGHHGTCSASPVVLESLPGLPTNRNPSINLFGHVVAAAEVLANGNFFTRPAFWKKRSWRRGGAAYEAPEELPIPEGYTDASAVDINVFGKVVGTASMRDGRFLLASSAAVWKRHRHGWRPDVAESPEGATFVSGTRLNDVGKVVGNDIRPSAGATGALLWEPRWFSWKK